ncbi:MAG: hypothetical protein QM736_10975 [Vicinamibacterales bacterium]
MNGMDIVKKLRAHLDKHGFQDVEIKCRRRAVGEDAAPTPISRRSLMATYDAFGIPHAPASPDESIMGGYWPAYLFAGDMMNIPIVGRHGGPRGQRARRERISTSSKGAGKVYGMAGAEKSVATVLLQLRRQERADRNRRQHQLGGEVAVPSISAQTGLTNDVISRRLKKTYRLGDSVRRGGGLARHRDG